MVLPLAPELDGLESSADRASFARVLVDDDFGRLAGSVETRADEIHLRLDGCKVVLSATLEDEPGAQFGEVRNLRDVKPDILRQHRRQTGQYLVRLHPWPWKLAMSACRNTAHP